MYTITGTLYYTTYMKKENGIYFFVCLHPKKHLAISTQFSTGFFVCCSCRNCHSYTLCVVPWCVFNVEQNEVWHQHHLRQIRIVKRKKIPVSAHRGSLVVPLSARRKITKRRTQLFFVIFSPFLWLPRNVTVYGDASSGSDDVLPRLFSYIRIISTSRSWPDEIYIHRER